MLTGGEVGPGEVFFLFSRGCRILRETKLRRCFFS